MARLAAIQKGLFYPTPQRVLDLIVKTVKLRRQTRRGRLLDPCAGEGVASVLASAWNMDSYGVELHKARAVTAAGCMTNVLHGSFHQLSAPSKAFSVLFLNPPYDSVEAEGTHESWRTMISVRQELSFLRGTRNYLAEGGLLVLVVPGRLLQDTPFRECLAGAFTNIRAYRFPDPEFAAFKQVVIFATRAHDDPRGVRYNTGYLVPNAATTILGEETYGVEAWRSSYEGGPTKEPIALPDVPTKFWFDLAGRNPYTRAPGLTGGCYRLPQWKTLTGEADLCTFTRPLVEPRPGHVAMLLAAGALNGTEIGRRIVKGSSEKIKQEILDHDAELAIQRERIVSRMSSLDLDTGELEQWRTDEDQEKTRKWFEAHGAHLAAAVRRDHVALYDGRTDHLPFHEVQAPGVFPGQKVPKLLDAQKSAAAAIVEAWLDYKTALVSGEMGTGKTTIATIAALLAKFEKVVVMCPTHLVKKWIREVDTIAKARGTAVSALSIDDVDRFFDSPQAKFLILSKERAKLGARWEPAVNRRRVRVEREEVDYEAERRRPSSYGYSRHAPAPIMKTVSEIVLAPTCPTCGSAVLDTEGFPVTDAWLAKTKRACSVETCKGALWQAKAISDLGTKRWPLAKYINERYPRRYALVMDEAHQYANPSSDQSRAAQLLLSGAYRVLAMTGTIYGGYASTIFHLLYKVDPKFRTLYEYTDSARFVADHGLLETVHPLEEYTSKYGNRRNQSGGRTREVPGVNPAMLNLLLGNTVFLKLRDLGHAMPPFEEEVVVLEHDDEVKEAVQALTSEVRSVLREKPKLLGKYLMACLGYPDCPEHEEAIVDEEGEMIASAPAFPSALWPKDSKLLDIVRSERRRGRKVLVFFTQTGKRSPIPRVKDHLERAGFTVSVLDGGVPPDEREEWLTKRAGDFDIMLTNGRLVETGLDLLFAKTIVQYSTEYSIPTLRQSTRRSWRLGQTDPVKVYYFAYKDTLQGPAMKLIARKMRASELVDGDDAGGLAQHDETGADFMMELAREAAGAV